MISQFKLSLYACDCKPLPWPEYLWRDAYLFNAPRPLVGNISGEGEWHCGIYYALVNPASQYAAQDIETNRKLDAVLLVPATMEQILELGESVVPEKYRTVLCKLHPDCIRDVLQDAAIRYVEENSYETVMEKLKWN